MTAIPKHYVVPVLSPHSLSGLFLEENQREYFTYNFQESLILSSKAYAELTKPICSQITLLCALSTVLTWDHSTSGGTADAFVCD